MNCLFLVGNKVKTNKQVKDAIIKKITFVNRIHQRFKAESEPSCVSLKSDKSNDVVHFKSSESPAAER